MRVLSSALQTVLANGPPYVVADLWTLTLSNGTVLHWTSGQQPLTIGGTDYVLGPPIERGKVSWKLGLSVDQLSVTMYDDGNTTINGQALTKAAWQNMFDLATVELRRFVSDSWANTAVGSVEYFTGLVGDVKVSEKKISLTVESQLAQLKSTFPRTYVLPSCANTLYDAVCGVVESSFTFTGTVGGTPTASQFTLSGVSQPDNLFQQGKIKFTSGANSGQVRSVKSYVGGVVTLIYPLYEVPAVGDGVTAIAGCNKTRATCNGTFSNITHFRGFPYVPDPSVQVSGASSGTGTPTGGGSGGGGSGGRGPRGGHGQIKQK